MMDMTEMLYEAAKRGGEVLISYYHKELHISSKSSHQSLLTQADLHSQEEIVRYITAMMIKDSLIMSYISSNAKAREQWFDAVERLNVKTRGTRIIGSCVLDMTLFSDPRNNGNICLNSHTYLWDIAAAKLIVDEAGGALTDWQGNPIELHTEDPSITYQVLVCHPDNLKEIVGIINS